ncbi:mucin-5AC isoform X2 [Hyalella azteca]|nr:mucin-5AC isoform X2 [Hyalella azteca]XP_047737254.1 mucin-5AC isoform X2 [Hyalella azteca]
MMLVECATTSSNSNVTNYISTTFSSISLNSPTCTSSATSCATSAKCTNVNCSTSLGSNTTSGYISNGPSGNDETKVPVISAVLPVVNIANNSASDLLSSGSNSCSDSLGNSISTNSISNSNSIGNSWRFPKNEEEHFNGGNCESPWHLQSSMEARPGANYSANRSPVFSESNLLQKACSDTAGRSMKYGSPLSESKICKKSNGKVQCESKSISNMVDVEACLANTPPHLLIRSLSSLSHHSTQLSTLPRPQEQEPVGSHTLQKGVLQQARDRIFSRWKERYFVLTRDYLACFRRGSTKYSEMGSFIFKVNLASVEGVYWEERRGSAVVAVELPREGRVLLRARANEAHLLQGWYRALLDATTSSKLRRTALRRGTSTSTLHLHPSSSTPYHSSTAPHHSTATLPHHSTTTLPHPPSLSLIHHAALPHSSPSGMSSCSSSKCGTEERLSCAKLQQQRTSACPGGSLDTDPPSTPLSSLTSLHKLSSNASSGSGCGSSVASSPGLGTCIAPSGWSPRSRFSLVESPRRPLPSAASMCPPKTRHSLCLDPSDQPHSRLLPTRTTPLTPISSSLGFPSARRFTHSPAGHTRRSLCLDSLSASRTSLVSLTPRNPLLELLETCPPPSAGPIPCPVGPSAGPSPCSKGPSTGLNPCPVRPSAGLNAEVAQPSEAPPSALAQPRTRTSLTLFRNSPLFN